MNKKVSSAVVKRLPRYYRYLGELLKQNVDKISSKELAKMMDVTASQIRQDLNCFGGFGQQGYGYNVSELHSTLSKILGINRAQDIIIIGAGNLCHALSNHAGFSKRGFNLVAIFDNDKEKIGTEINGIKVLSVSELGDFISKNNVRHAILTLPKNHTQEVADIVVSHGVRGLWNFSNMDLNVPDDVCVENVHLLDSLMTLSFNVNN